MAIDKERIRVGVLMGGASAEREVSLASGRNIVETLDRSKYEVYPIEIGMDSKWYLHHLDSPLLDPTDVIETEPGPPETYVPPPPSTSELVTGRVMRGRIDVIFPALHGPGGEDGTLQGFLDTMEIPYVGSGVLASALTMDKARCKTFLAAHGLPTPKWITFTRGQWERGRAELCEEIGEKFTEGYVVKPNNQGSTLGMALMEPGEEPERAVTSALSYSSQVLIEQWIRGRELTCGVYGGEEPETLPVTEIRTATGFFDYAAKYQPGRAQEITPADIPEDLTKEIQSLANRAHCTLGCSGLSRTDFMLDGDRPTILETNTIPGMSRMSLIPRACATAGIEFDTILDRIIGEALFSEQLVPVG